MTRALLVTVYLGAIVAANLSVEHFGPEASVVNAFLFIGLDLSCRDALHELWAGRVLRNMALLIATGSALSYLLNRDAGRIALASCVAFAAAAATDALLYHVFRDRPWYERVNHSNVGGATVDSLLFLPLAFGTFPWLVMFAQACAKVAGGVVWSLLLFRERPDLLITKLPPMGPAERLRFEFWGQRPSGPRSDAP
jgi:queuosine precursor transporter